MTRLESLSLSGLAPDGAGLAHLRGLTRLRHLHLDEVQPADSPTWRTWPA